MPRSKLVPARENGDKKQDVKWVRHLLRHLDNGSALRTNPLVGLLWNSDDNTANFTKNQEFAQTVSDIVRAAIRSVALETRVGKNAIHATRRAEILERYDLRGQLSSDICKFLGICKSKYQYERRAALARLGEQIKARLEMRAMTTSALPDGFKVQEQHAHLLMEAGLFDMAAGTLRRLQRQVPDAGRRAAYAYQLIKVLWQSEKVREAREELSAARRECAGELTSNAGFEVEASLATARMVIATSREEIIDSLEFLQRERSRIASLSESKDPALRSTAAVLLHQAGSLLGELGNLSESIFLHEKALVLLNQFTSVEPFCGHEALFRADILSSLASALAFEPGRLGEARERNAEALSVAARHNSLIRMARAHSNEAVYGVWSGQHKTMLVHAELADSLVKALGGTIDRHRIALVHARALAASGLLHEAQLRVRRVKSDPQLHAYPAAIASIFESEILALAGQRERSLAAGEAALRIAFELRIERIVGKAMRVVAEAHEALGNKTQAMAYVDPAIANLEHAGDPFSLARACGCSARITRNRRHRGMAADLLASMSRAVAQ
ncbi:MAG: hypothetical protein M3Z14_03030 [Candidatus Eremiobacteraeota bacterium]|nr:hypothetical protein [Candidatus Eremiobacteraeota bacterium]